MRIFQSKFSTGALLGLVISQAAGFTTTTTTAAAAASISVDRRRRAFLPRGVAAAAAAAAAAGGPLSVSVSTDFADHESSSSPSPETATSSSSSSTSAASLLFQQDHAVNQEILLMERAVATAAAEDHEDPPPNSIDFWQRQRRREEDQHHHHHDGAFSVLPYWVGGSALLAVAATTSHLLPSEILHNNPVTHAAPILLQHLPSMVWDSYQSVLARHPIATKAATSAFVYALGDILAQQQQQQGSEERSRLDMSRVMKSLIAGGVGHGPLSHVWYNVSEEFFHNIVHWTAWWSFVPKIVVDQFVWGPIWTTIYLAMIGLMNRESVTEIKTNVQTSLLPLVVDGLKLWPLAHCVTYGVIPVEHRLLWVDLVEILWVSILANAATTSTASTAAAAGQQAIQQQEVEEENYAASTVVAQQEISLLEPALVVGTSTTTTITNSR